MPWHSIFSKNIRSGPSQKIKLAFDLDGVLVFGVIRNDEPLALSPEARSFLAQHGCLLNPQAAHYMPLGVRELLRLVLQGTWAPWVEVIFFSAGLEFRNRALVKALITAAIGETGYNHIAASITIISREQITPILSAEEGRSIDPDGYHGVGAVYPRYPKNLTQIAKPHELPHTLLIDDSRHSVYPGQHHHVMLVPSSHIASLNALLHHSCCSPDELLFQKLNAIFYITGLLKLYFRHTKTAKTERPISEFIGDLYAGSRPSTSLWQRAEYYALGLQQLQKLNPALSFMTQARLVVEPPISFPLMGMGGF